jgi:hypothetical protein
MKIDRVREAERKICYLLDQLEAELSAESRRRILGRIATARRCLNVEAASVRETEKVKRVALEMAERHLRGWNSEIS